MGASVATVGFLNLVSPTTFRWWTYERVDDDESAKGNSDAALRSDETGDVKK